MCKEVSRHCAYKIPCFAEYPFQGPNLDSHDLLGPVSHQILKCIEEKIDKLNQSLGCHHVRFFSDPPKSVSELVTSTLYPVI
jgi:hypothetical protein